MIKDSEVKRMAHLGVPVRAAARLMGVSHRNLMYRWKQLGLPVRKSGRPSKAKYQELLNLAEASLIAGVELAEDTLPANVHRIDTCLELFVYANKRQYKFFADDDQAGIDRLSAIKAEWRVKLRDSAWEPTEGELKSWRGDEGNKSRNPNNLKFHHLYK